MSDKKHDIIFEVPKASVPPSVQALMDKAEERLRRLGLLGAEGSAEAVADDLLGDPLEIDFIVQNDKVRYSIAMPSSDVAGQVVLAKSIVRAVQSYEVVPTELPGKTLPSMSVGKTSVSYNRCVRIDWKTQKIFTNFKPDEGESFLGGLAIVVEELQRGEAKKAGGSKS